MGEELFDAQLIRKAQLKVRELRVKVTHQFGLGRHVLLNQRNGPGIRARSPAVVLRKRIAWAETPACVPHCAGAGSGVPWVGDKDLGAASGSKQKVVATNSPK